MIRSMEFGFSTLAGTRRHTCDAGSYETGPISSRRPVLWYGYLWAAIFSELVLGLREDIMERSKVAKFAIMIFVVSSPVMATAGSSDTVFVGFMNHWLQCFLGHQALASGTSMVKTIKCTDSKDVGLVTSLGTGLGLFCGWYNHCKDDLRNGGTVQNVLALYKVTRARRRCAPCQTEQRWLPAKVLRQFCSFLRT